MNYQPWTDHEESDLLVGVRKDSRSGRFSEVFRGSGSGPETSDYSNETVHGRERTRRC